MMMNYKVILISDGTATLDDEEHNATLGNMLAMFADVMTTDEVVVGLSRTLSQAAEYSIFNTDRGARAAGSAPAGSRRSTSRPL